MPIGSFARPLERPDMDALVQTKRCGKCKAEKLITEFHLNRIKKDGYDGRCKACRSCPRPTTADRFWSKVDKSGTVHPTLGTACWLWTASVNRLGYGDFRYEGKITRAHRTSYQMFVGEIPDSLELDHLCRVRRCVNPNHLEPVTHTVNVLRGESPAAKHAVKTHCPRGHEYTKENTKSVNGGRSRWCRACHREDSIARYYAKKSA